VLSSKPVERNYLRELTKRYEGNIHFAVDQYVEDKVLGKAVFAEKSNGPEMVYSSEGRES
jgi:hypothetical protein